jgi:predicted nucleotidyltransferase
MIYLNSVEKKAVEEFTLNVRHELKENLFDIKLFGSKQTGKFNADSDIDVLIIVRERTVDVINKIADILLDVELKYSSKISPIVLTSYELLQNEKHKTLFFDEITRNGVTL